MIVQSAAALHPKRNARGSCQQTLAEVTTVCVQQLHPHANHHRPLIYRMDAWKFEASLERQARARGNVLNTCQALSYVDHQRYERYRVPSCMDCIQETHYVRQRKEGVTQSNGRVRKKEIAASEPIEQNCNHLIHAAGYTQTHKRSVPGDSQRLHDICGASKY